MASRGERLQQRLRGLESQRRQGKDVKFDFVLPAVAVAAPAPAPPSVQPTNEQTPQAKLPLQASSRRTPATRNRPDSMTNVGAAAAAQDERQPVMRSGNVDANISAKRRMLDTDVPPEPSSSRSTRSSRSAPRPDVYAIPEDEAQEALGPEISIAQDDSEVVTIAPKPAYEPTSEPVSQRRPRAARTPELFPPPNEEITESPADAPGSGHRSRVVLAEAVSASSKLHVLQESSLVESELETPVRRKRKRGETTATPTGSKVPRRQEVSAASIDDIDELSPDQPIRHTRRQKAVVEQESSLLEDPSKVLAEQEEAEAIDDLQAAAILKKNRGRRTSRDFRPDPSPDLDEAETQQTTKAKRRKVQKAASPAKQSHPKKSSTKSKQEPKNSKLRDEPPIPVTVHRLTRQPMYDEEESDADILNSEIPLAKRGGVHAIDVLRDFCQEVINSGLETLEEGGNSAKDAALRREYKTKWRALKSFGEELRRRLLEHAVNLDNSYALEKRVREQQKKKLSLRDEILRVRAERQQIALQMDEIRIRHENESNNVQNRDAANIAIYDTELAVERGKDAEPLTAVDGNIQKEGLEVLLKRVAGEVSNDGHSGGILQRIKDFNAFLERAASALESKRV